MNVEQYLVSLFALLGGMGVLLALLWLVLGWVAPAAVPAGLMLGGLVIPGEVVEPGDDMDSPAAASQGVETAAGLG